MAQDYIPRTVDINGAIESFSVKQFDNGSRALHLTLLDKDNPNEQTVNLSSHSAVMWCKLPSGQSISITGSLESTDAGVICFILDSNVTAEIGTVNAEIVISDSHSALSLHPFKFEVLPSLYTPQ